MYKPYIWMGDEHNQHILDYERLEVDRANAWVDSLHRGIDEMGVMIYCTCGEWTFPRFAKDFLHKHWETCGK